MTRSDRSVLGLHGISVSYVVDYVSERIRNTSVPRHQRTCGLKSPTAKVPTRSSFLEDMPKEFKAIVPTGNGSV